MRKFAIIFIMASVAAVQIFFPAPSFAANPFMDVPPGHWAYDAIEKLASRGVALGYPDGAYKGGQPATRYEMASMVARALASMDRRRANKQDIELLKKLVLEYKSEIVALGVKTEDLDKRFAVIEEGVGGWNIRGIFRFDAMFASSDNDESLYTQSGNEREFNKERLRFFLTKTIDENTYFYAQYNAGGDDERGLGDIENSSWSQLYVDTRFLWDTTLRIGRFDVDFEGDLGLYEDDDALFGDFSIDGFQFRKSWPEITATAVIGRNSALDDLWADASGSGELGVYMTYILDVNWTPGDSFFAGATGYWGVEDSAASNVDIDINTYALYAGVNFNDTAALKAIYYFQELGGALPSAAYGDTPNAWKAIIDIPQETLRFTSLWLEYSQVDNNFVTNAWPRYGIGGANQASAMLNQPVNDGTTSVWFALAVQQWSERWSTIARFTRTDFDTPGLDNAVEWGVGVGYQYSPAIYFELMYDQVNFGTHSASYLASPQGNTYVDKESVLRFRTAVSF